MIIPTRTRELLSQYFNTHDSYADKLTAALGLSSVNQLVQHLANIGSALSATPEDIIQVISGHDFQDSTRNMTPRTDLKLLIAKRLNPNLIPENPNINVRNSNEIPDNNRWSNAEINKRTPAEQIAYLEEQVRALKIVNEKLALTVARQANEIARLSNPNAIPSSTEEAAERNNNRKSS